MPPQTRSQRQGHVLSRGGQPTDGYLCPRSRDGLLLDHQSNPMLWSLHLAPFRAVVGGVGFRGSEVSSPWSTCPLQPHGVAAYLALSQSDRIDGAILSRQGRCTKVVSRHCELADTGRSCNPFVLAGSR